MQKRLQNGAAKPDDLVPTHKKLTAALEKLQRIAAHKDEVEAKIAETGGKPKPASFEVQIKNAKGLPVGVKCFVRLSVPGEAEDKKTEIQIANDDSTATWNETFLFDTVDSDASEATVSVIQEMEEGEKEEGETVQAETEEAETEEVEAEAGETKLTEFKVELASGTDSWLNAAAEDDEPPAAATGSEESGFEEIDEIDTDEDEDGAEKEGADEEKKEEVDLQVTTSFTAAEESLEPLATVLTLRKEKALTDLQVYLRSGRKKMDERDLAKIAKKEKAAKEATLVGGTMKRYNAFMTPDMKVFLQNMGIFVGGIAAMHFYGDVMDL